jgi:hypothetical protein
MPAPGAPKANRIPGSVLVAPLGVAGTAKLSLAPSGNQAQAQDSSWGRKIGRPSHAA